MVLVWHGQSRDAASAAAMQDLARLERELARYDARLPDDGSVRVVFGCAEIDDAVAAGSAQAAHGRLRELIGRVLASSAEAPLARHAESSSQENFQSGGA
jgi:RNA-splicing ligase RtcB